MADPLAPCPVHELAGCSICKPSVPGYQRGLRALDVPYGSYVEIKGGKGVYHHPDCYNATGDWDGADTATLGERLVRGPEKIREHSQRPAQCCEPPTMR